MGRLDGKVAIITGAARGMGAQHARAFVAEGARVVLGDVLTEQAAALATELGEHAASIHLDVTQRTQWDAAVALAESRFGDVTVLVNNAGIATFGNIETYPVEEFRKVLEINLIGTLHGIQSVVPAMRRAGTGSIINVSSLAGMKGFPMVPGYVASKWAVRGLTKNAALDLGMHGIRVNSVHPGTVRTAMTADHEYDLDPVALHRTAADHELSPLMVFLASDESSYFTGAEFVPDGGELAGQALPMATAGELFGKPIE